MKTRVPQWLILFSVLLAFVLLAPTCALADDDDPPTRVARLSSVRGQVSFSPAGTDDWVSAVLNRPLTTGDKLWADQGGRAELHVGSATIRLGDQTGFSFLNLDDRMIQLSLTEGSINLRVRRLEENEAIEVDTPNLAFSILRPGRYRISVNEGGDTTIINVREGEGEVSGGGSAYTLHPGQQGYFTGTDSLSADVEALPDPDDFDSWSDERDLREDHAVARRYVSEDVVGYEDLDEYGGWRSTPEYGTIWFPHVTVVGWAPYRYGHWVWISPWGWTWVDDAPWGYAPFHYGRWVSVRGAWGWVPCPPRTVAVAYVRPVYAPALVAWVGGPHFAAGIGVGGGFAAGVNVGWFPLGPREVFVPSYPVSRTYVNRVNISNTTVNETVVNNYYNTTVVNKNVTVNNVTYVNQRVAGAVTATSPHAFTSAQPVARNMVAVNQKEIETAPTVVHAPAVAPPKQAALGTGAASNAHPPAAVQARPVVAKVAPPPAPPAFAVRQAAIEKNQGRPISIAETRQLAPAAQAHANVAPVKIAPPSKPATPTFNKVQQGGNKGNAAPGQVNANRPPNANNSAQPNAPVNQPNRPPANTPPNTAPNNQVNQPNRPATASGNAPNNAPTNAPVDTRARQDRPPASRPAAPVNPQLEQKHQGQNQQLQQKQDQEYQKLQQKQAQEQQKIQQQKNADAQQQLQQKQVQEQQKIQQQKNTEAQQQQVQQKQVQDQQKIQQQKNAEAQQQQLQQKHQQELQQLQQKQAQQQQTLQQKQEAEHAKAYKAPPQSKPSEDKSKDKSKDNSKDKDKDKPKN